MDSIPQKIDTTFLAPYQIAEICWDDYFSTLEQQKFLHRLFNFQQIFLWG